VAAIVSGPLDAQPAERDGRGRVFGLTAEQIVWGHVTPFSIFMAMGPGECYLHRALTEL